MTIPQYLLESSLGLLLFYGFYHYVLRRETFFQLNRIYLLLTPLLALTVPLLDIELGTPAVPEASALPDWFYPAVSTVNEMEVMIWEPVSRPVPLLTISVGDLLLPAYLLGVAVMGWRLLSGIWRLGRLIRCSRRRQEKGYTLVETDLPFPAASFFGYLFWNTDRLERAGEILEHELVHMRQWHSLDVLLMEFMVVVKWFNPLIYGYRHSLRTTHEYIADRYVVQRSGSAYHYARLLVEQGRSNEPATLVNTFNSLIKTRLMMLNQSPSRTWKAGKYLLSLPLLAGLMMLFSFNLVDNLPGEVSDRIHGMENYLQDLGNTPVLQVKQEDPVYRFEWGSFTCDCFRDQLESIFHCDNLTLRARELRELVSSGVTPQILRDGESRSIADFSVISRRTLQIKDQPSQYDDQGTYDPDSPFWQELRKGDIIKLTFRAGEKDWFKLNIRLNDRRHSMDYAYLVRLGEEQLAIDMETGLGIKYLEEKAFHEALVAPLTFWQNEGEPLPVDHITIKNSGLGFRSRLTLDGAAGAILREQPPVRLARAGDRLDFDLETDKGKLQFSLVLRADAGGTLNRDPDLKLTWGDHEATLGGNYSLSGRQLTFELTREQIREVINEPLILRLNGREYRPTGCDMVFFFPGPPAGNGKPLSIDDFQGGPRAQRFPRGVMALSPGVSAGFIGFEVEDGLQFDLTVTVPVQFDAAEYYQDGVSFAKFNDEGTVVNFLRPERLLLKRFNDLYLQPSRPPLLIVDGEKYHKNRFIIDGRSVLSSGEVLEALSPADVRTFRVHLPEAAGEMFGALPQFGAIEIVTKDPDGTADFIRTLEEMSNREAGVPIDTGKVDVMAAPEPVRVPSEALGVDVLYIIDGKQYQGKEIEPVALDPGNIKSVTVLKDKAALEKYGEAGRNGVVIIETKRKKAQKDPPVTPFKPDALELDLPGEEEASDASLLYVIDGRQYPGDEGKAALRQLSPEHIESVHVLKDKAAVERYGEMGRNGVIEIRTKAHLKADAALDEIDRSFKVFPNAATDWAQVSLYLPEKLKVNLAVLTFEGQHLLDLHKGKLPEGTHLFDLERARLGAAGTYLVHLTIGERVWVRQVVFQ